MAGKTVQTGRGIEYQNGYLYRIKFNGTTVWQLIGVDDYSRITGATIGSVSASWWYGGAGNRLSGINAAGIQNYNYEWDGATGNLNKRTNSGRGLTESFYYDTEKLDRLTSVTGPSALNLTYQPNNKGNILSKSDAGTEYLYGTSRKYTLEQINNGINISTAEQRLTYTAFNKVATISEGDKMAEFVYNADNQRIRMTLKSNGTVTKTRWYFGGSCEREQVGSTVTQYIWIGGDAYTAVAVAKKTGTGSWVVYNIFRDHLGTITHLKNGSTIDEYSFDAWGRRRDKDTWSYTLSGEPALFADRGFTSHEFLSDFNLYNMNGRLYDPVLGRFFSPDPYIADPYFSQSYNRYAYCLNNPLKFTDPSGEVAWPVIWFGNWVLGGLHNWMNRDMTFKEAFSFKNNPVAISFNYHLGSNTLSNSQASAQRLVGAMARSGEGINRQIAGFSGMGRYGDGPLFTTTPFDQFVGESPLGNWVVEPKSVDAYTGATIDAGPYEGRFWRDGMPTEHYSKGLILVVYTQTNKYTSIMNPILKDHYFRELYKGIPVLSRNYRFHPVNGEMSKSMGLMTAWSYFLLDAPIITSETIKNAELGYFNAFETSRLNHQKRLIKYYKELSIIK